MKIPENVRWNFLIKSKAEKGLNPVQKEFFGRDGDSIIPKIVESFVRESIQNSLDATLPGENLKIVFRLRDGKKSINNSKFKNLFSGLKSHIESDEPNIDDIPNWDDSLPFIAVEDFNTSGLLGDTSIDMPPKGSTEKNDFCNFWRNLAGFTAKNSNERGKWGLGKAVFPASSKINTFFGVTTRPLEGEFHFLGLSVLDTHRLKSDPHTVYKPYGDFGHFDDINEGNKGFVQPVTDTDFNVKILEMFHSERLVNQSGLSLFVPYPLDDFKAEFLILSILQQYYYPFLKGEIEVEVDYNGEVYNIVPSNIIEILDGLKNPFESDSSKSADWEYHISRFKDILDFSIWICNQTNEDFIMLNPLGKAHVPRWSNTLFENNDWDVLRSKFSNSDRLAFKVPIWVKKADRDPVLCYFNVFVSSDSDYDSFINEFIRHDLTIPEIKGLEKRGFKGFVIIENGDNDKYEALVEMVGLSENPAHTTWGSNQDKFKKANYEHGDESLTFIKKSLGRIYKELQDIIKEKDDTLLSDLFPLDDEREEPGDTPPPPPPPPPPIDPPKPNDPDEPVVIIPPMPPDINGRSPRLLISQIDGGFKIIKHPNYSGNILSFSIELGYKKKNKHPIKKYHPNDFNLQTNIIKTDYGLIHTAIGPNSVTLNVVEQGFEIKFDGFDPNRDLVIMSNVNA